MANLHGQKYGIKLKQGLRSALLGIATSYLGVQGEPHYTTDTKQLFIHDGTVVQPVQSLDMACMNDGDVVTNDGEIVYTF